ncbi:alpha-L-rhamnosidase [Enemella evansiae]|uniref:alpha-L-rhamnosidase n=1 Tax=Enemella evansiae TaxID=2016499 RepID=UPI000B979549|nr:alpha-L-rhamnosidase [Enemella evansiae]OYO13043.1 alpha-L-rhamnosidase [Enemella evansiae]
MTTRTDALNTAALNTAVAITADVGRDEVVALTTAFRLDQPVDRVRSATLWATAHGVFEVAVNDRQIDDSVLNPGWSSYEWRLPVTATDVAALLTEEENRVTVRLGNGWWRGDLGFEGAHANYGEELAFLGALVIGFDDGSEQVIATGPDWSAQTTDTLANSLYDGQAIDARRRGNPDPLQVREAEIDRTRLVPHSGPPVTRQETLRSQEIWRSPSGATLVDFGQNLVGWLRFTVIGPEGTVITIRHAEVLEDGELGTRPLRSAKQTDTFTLSGGEDFFEPTFTFHGFRYAEVTGWPGELTADDLEAVVVQSVMTRTGWFSCSDDRVNQLVANSVWGQKGNFLDVPTDCPQRDERLGWTGDIAAYAATAAYQFDVADFLHSWLLDLAEEARNSPNGWVPHVVPDVLTKHAQFSPEFTTAMEGWQGPTAIWGDAAVWVPQALWYAYGDRDRLAAHYPGMVVHLDGVEQRLSDSGLWDTGFQFGDWLDPDASPHEPWNAKADSGVVATACLYRSAAFTAEAARELGHDSDAERWQALADRTRTAFNDAYVAEDGTIRSDCATVYALALCFGLLDEQTRPRAAVRLAEVVEAAGCRVSTGFAGTPFVTWALSENGYVEHAYRLLLETGCPSWLYPVTMGATTIWERWDSMLPDGSINPGEMTSFNHYALGAVADWLYQVVAGIRPAAPGYGRLLLQPRPGPGLDWARGALETRHGRVECGWRRTDAGVEVEIVVPDGIAADLVLPDGSRRSVTAGRHTFTAEEAYAGA